METGRWSRWVGWLWRVATLATLALLAPPPALAHIFARDGEQADILEDMLINFVLPVAVLAVGAVVGVVLSRWLGRRGPTDPDDDGADTAVEDGAVSAGGR